MYRPPFPLLTIGCLLFFSASLFAQPSVSFGEKVPVRGTLIKKSSGEPLSYATVAVYRKTDSTMVNNALTGPRGSFELSLAPGKYYAVCEYVGFKDKTISGIVVTEAKSAVKLGKVQMVSDAVSLQEVEVRAERSQMEMKLDRRVFNVGKDLANAGGTAADLLDRIPSLNVDTEGNISLRGSQNVRILVNGKASGFINAEEVQALQRLQGDIIKSVEVITNPSSRYEAQGEGGIINILLKKNQEKGFNGSFGLATGYPHDYGASYNLNYRQSDLNFFSNFGLNYRDMPGGGEATRRFYDGAGNLESFYTTDTDQDHVGWGGNIQFGADWFINARNLLTVSGLFRGGKEDRLADVTYRDFSAEGDLIERTFRDNDEVEDETNIEGAINYTRSFAADEDREWTVDFKYISDDDTETADYVETSNLREKALIQRSSNTEDERRWLFKTDYVHPIGEDSKFETGLRTELRQVNNDFLVEEEQDDGSYVALPDFNGRLEYTENVYAAYAQGSHEFGDFALQAGLRAEYSDILAELVGSDGGSDQNYLSLFPSTALTYKFSDENQLQFSYSRRISRPYFRRLIPFSNFTDRRNNSVGNPNLRPEFSNVLETGFLHYFKNGSLLSSLYYRHTEGTIQRIVLPADDGTTIRFPINLSDRDAYGLELNLSYEFFDWWNFNSNVNFFRSTSNGTFEGQEYSAETFTWNGQINTKLALGENFDVQPAFDYDAPRETTQGRRLANYGFDIGVSTEIFNGKGTLTLSGEDLFNTRKDRIEIDQAGYEEESFFQWRRDQQIRLNFTYRLDREREAGSLQQRGR